MFFLKRKLKKSLEENSTDENNTEASSSGKKPKKGIWKIFRLRNFFILAAMLVAIIIAAVPIVRFAVFTDKKVEGIVLSVLNNSLGRDVKVSSFKYSLLATGVEIEDIVIYNSDKFGSKENVTIGKINVALSIPSLLMLRANIKDISLEDINIYLFTDENGNWNIPDLKESEKEEKIEEYKEPFDLTKLDFIKP